VPEVRCEVTAVVDPAVEVAAWNEAHKPGTLVQWRTNLDSAFTNTGQTWTDAYLLKGVPTVRATAGDFVPLANVRIHPAAERLAALAKVKVEGLEFPPPVCGFCSVDTYHDGDGFTCPQCRAWWNSNGNDGQRRCVECCSDDAAEVIDVDMQPRCLPCAAGILEGAVEATGPYKCRRCKAVVVGIGPQHGRIFTESLCGSCRHSVDVDADLARAERSAVAA
jgi:hypothetical protein